MASSARCLLASLARVSTRVSLRIQTKAGNTKSITRSTRTVYMCTAGVYMSNGILPMKASVDTFYPPPVVGCVSKVNQMAIEYCGSSSSDVVEDLSADDEGDTWSLYRTTRSHTHYCNV